MNTHKDIIVATIDRDWLHLYPTWVQEVFKRALQSDTLPSYATVQVAKALKVAKAINAKMDRQASIEVPGTKAKGGNYSHRKAARKAADAAYRAKMKGNNPAPNKHGKR